MREYTALIALGKGRNGYGLTLESKMTALAAGELYKRHMSGKIIFAGGKTSGDNHNSEAKDMASYLRKHRPDIPQSDIILEENSIDTLENARNVRPILETHKFSNLTLITLNYHIPRAERIFAENGIPTFPYSTELLIGEISCHHSHFAKKYMSSLRRKLKVAKESLVRAIGQGIAHTMALSTRG